MLIILFGFYMALEYVFKVLGPGHEIKYELNIDGKVFGVEETYTARNKKEKNSYHFKINVDDIPFYFQTYYDFKNYDKVIKDIKYINVGKYICILPLFVKDVILSDFKCFDGSEYVFYNLIRGQSKDLDNLVENVNVKNYNYAKYATIKGDSFKDDHLDFYFDSMLENHYLGITTYKGLYVATSVGDELDFVSLFSKDVYEQSLSTFIDKYYVVADYNSNYSFNTFYIVDLTNKKVETIKTHHQISFDSYFQGGVENRLYLIDKSNMKQFELDLKSKTVIEYGNLNTGVRVFRNGKWDVEPLSKALENKLMFESNYKAELAQNPYYRIDKVGGELTGYYYYYLKKGNEHYVYRAEAKNKNDKTLIFISNSLNDVTYHDDYIYFYDENDVSYYHDSAAKKSVIKNQEYEFNKTLKYAIYIK